MKTATRIYLACIMLLTSCFSPTNSPVDICGFYPGALRLLSANGPLNTTACDCRVCLRRISIENDSAAIYIGIRDPQHNDSKDFRSHDGGVTWNRITSDKEFRTDITTTQTEDLEYILSRADQAIVYSNLGVIPGAEFKRSMDGGRSYSKVTPLFAETASSSIDRFDIISTGARARGRVYARIYSGKQKAVCRSEDYGDHFDCFMGDATFIHENASDANRLYCFGDFGLMRSTDDGRNWKKLEGGKELFRPIYKNRKDGLLRTQMIDLSDEIFEPMEAVWYFPSWLRQIESDPHNADILYVLCIKGLFRSIDGGDSFRLLKLASNEIRGIAKIGIDPLNGNNLYAVVGTTMLNKSTDMGCSWKRLETPIN